VIAGPRQDGTIDSVRARLNGHVTGGERGEDACELKQYAPRPDSSPYSVGRCRREVDEKRGESQRVEGAVVAPDRRMAQTSVYKSLRMQTGPQTIAHHLGTRSTGTVAKHTADGKERRSIRPRREKEARRSSKSI